MKTSALLLAFILPVAASAEIQFNGVVIDSAGRTKVSLINTDTLDSNWVTVPGGRFGNYTVTSYKAGRPADPMKKGDTGVKDTVVLSIAGRTQFVNLTDAVLNTTPATSVVSVTNAQANQSNVSVTLSDRLAQEMAKPNPDPQLIQALQRTIDRQAQQPGATPAGVTSVTTTPTGAVRIQQTIVNGQTVQTITTNGQQTAEQQAALDAARAAARNTGRPAP